MFWRSVFQFIAAPTTKNMENSPGSQRVKNHCSILYTILLSLSFICKKRNRERGLVARDTARWLDQLAMPIYRAAAEPHYQFPVNSRVSSHRDPWFFLDPLCLLGERAWCRKSICETKKRSIGATYIFGWGYCFEKGLEKGCFLFSILGCEILFSCRGRRL